MRTNQIFETPTNPLLIAFSPGTIKDTYRPYKKTDQNQICELLSRFVKGRAGKATRKWQENSSFCLPW